MITPAAPNQKTDNELVTLSLRNSDWFGILVERYEKKLLRYIRRLSGASNPDAEDILQEAFIKIYQHLNDFDTRLKFSSWVYRIVRNETFDRGRVHLKNKNVLVEMDEESWQKIASQFDLDRQVDNKIFREQIAAAIANLDTKYREPLLLYLLEEKSYEEISDILRRPIGTVGALISRGKQKLKIILSPTQSYVKC